MSEDPPSPPPPSSSPSPGDDFHSPGEHAHSVETVVVEDRGQWRVDIIVVFDDGVVRRTVNTFRSRRRAEVAASWMKRAAARDVQGRFDDI